MCDTYDAIYEIRKHLNQDEYKIMICLPHANVHGTIKNCETGCDMKCLKGIITLYDARVHNHMSNEVHEFKWLNIASKKIIAFSFIDK